MNSIVKLLDEHYTLFLVMLMVGSICSLMQSRYHPVSIGAGSNLGMTKVWCYSDKESINL